MNDFDNQNVLNNSLVFSYFETVHLHYFIRILKLGWNYNHVPLFVDEYEYVKFIKCVTPDTNVYVHLNILRVGAASITMEFFITDGPQGELHNKSILKLAYVNPFIKKVLPLPDEIRQKLNNIIKIQEHGTV